MSYGPNRSLFFEPLGSYIARIVKGARVGELPVEQPTRFEFIVNLKAAKTLGIKFPIGVLTRAEEVIELQACLWRLLRIARRVDIDFNLRPR